MAKKANRANKTKTVVFMDKDVYLRLKGILATEDTNYSDWVRAIAQEKIEK